MKVPTSLKIGYKKYKTVGLKKEDADRIGTQGIHGQIEYATEKILYCKDLPNTEVFNTLFHECLHGIVDHYGIPVESDHEEKLVTSLANAITCLFYDNPDFIEYMRVALFSPEEN